MLMHAGTALCCAHDVATCQSRSRGASLAAKQHTCRHRRPPHSLPLLTATLPSHQSNTLERRLFYIPSFKIYGAVAGFYDYGPPGCAIKQNLTQV
jgi:hypothetical protein